MPVLISIPIRIHRHKDLLVMPHSGEVHPLCNITLAAFFVSGDSSMTKDWQDSIVTSSLLLHVRPQTNNTNVAGKNGYFGVLNGKPIPFQSLKN